ncbi:metal ABC transporter ATP-binding protein [Agrococcus jenensis]|uniref:Zinc/manganese transport system ATP-binding protein n=1 Tax=Agrococcus jenensis TaxID=46353 RepID=A0A3N2ARM2_9MICO|nr:ATP-binding cassette domain-containing protein [Agrococcus jenensis]ROR65555.1 zinc/manganese transport system ATP-binding protein [Agrococcus jenensis]
MSTASALPTSGSTGIRVTDLVVRRGDVTALDALDCELPAGVVTAVVGGNGSGKSTLLEVLAGIVAPTTGAMAGLPDARALVVQRTGGDDRLPLTGRQAVEMGLWRELGPLRRVGPHGRRRVDAALDAVGMRGEAHRQLGAMSGGQRQRVLVAQGLVQDAPLLLLDEPAAAADVDARDRIDAALAERAWQGAVVVVATHDRASLARADRALLLDRGRLVAAGSPAEVAVAQAARAAAALAPQAGGAPVDERMTSTGA